METRMKICLVFLNLGLLVCGNNVLFVERKLRWDYALKQCNVKLGGTLLNIEEIPNDTLYNKFWVKSPKTTPWVSIMGCYKGVSKDIQTKKVSVPSGDVGIKRCSESCRRSYIAVRKQKCICVSTLSGLEKSNWQQCTNSTDNETEVHRVYEILPPESVASTDNRGDNCAKVNCEDQSVTPGSCNDSFRFLCSKHGSQSKMTWKDGMEHCLGKMEIPQQYGDRCKKVDGAFREQKGFFWFGTFRPVSRGSNKLECTVYNKFDGNTYSANCNEKFPFFCSINKTSANDNRTSSSDDLESTGTTKMRIDMSYLTIILMSLVGILILIIIGVCVVVVWLRKRLRNANDSSKDTKTRPENHVKEQEDKDKLRLPGSRQDENYEFYEIIDDSPETHYDQFIRNQNVHSETSGIYDHVKNVRANRQACLRPTAEKIEGDKLDTLECDMSISGQNPDEIDSSHDQIQKDESEYDEMKKPCRDTFEGMDMYDHIPCSEIDKCGDQYSEAAGEVQDVIK